MSKIKGLEEGAIISNNKELQEMNDDPGSRMHEITDVPIREKADNDDKIFEERNDEDLKVEEGYVDANAREVPVNNENVLIGDSLVRTTGESFPNVIPASRLVNEIKIQHDFDEISRGFNS